mmetsp:Transcript_145435/g.451103  ORF Transcript_145435/g.451103 Transcript_145435/m.451103 type:complete len:407 (-) Transcript_145435:265-1485(-)
MHACMHACPRRPWSLGWRVLVEVVLVEVALWCPDKLRWTVLGREEVLRLLDALRALGGVLLAIPEAHAPAAVPAVDVLLAATRHEELVVGDALQLVDADFAGRLGAVGAVASARGHTRAGAAWVLVHALLVVLMESPVGAGTRHAVPDGLGVLVRLVPLVGGEVPDVVAPDKVAVLVVLLVATPGPRAPAAVEGVAHAEVHADLVEGLGRLQLHLHADDARDAKLPGRQDDNLVVQVPHDAGEVRRVDVLGRVIAVAHGPVHVEAEKRCVAGARQSFVRRLVVSHPAYRPRHRIVDRRRHRRGNVVRLDAGVPGEGREELHVLALRGVGVVLVSAAGIARAAPAAHAGPPAAGLPAVPHVVLDWHLAAGGHGPVEPRRRVALHAADTGPSGGPRGIASSLPAVLLP